MKGKIYPDTDLCQECVKQQVRYKVFNTENKEHYYLCEKCLMMFDEVVETIVFTRE